jgi:hypothetical protein
LLQKQVGNRVNQFTFEIPPASWRKQFSRAPERNRPDGIESDHAVYAPDAFKGLRANTSCWLRRRLSPLRARCARRASRQSVSETDKRPPAPSLDASRKAHKEE